MTACDLASLRKMKELWDVTVDVLCLFVISLLSRLETTLMSPGTGMGWWWFREVRVEGGMCGRACWEPLRH